MPPDSGSADTEEYEGAFALITEGLREFVCRVDMAPTDLAAAMGVVRAEHKRADERRAAAVVARRFARLSAATCVRERAETLCRRCRRPHTALCRFWNPRTFCGAFPDGAELLNMRVDANRKALADALFYLPFAMGCYGCA